MSAALAKPPGLTSQPASSRVPAEFRGKARLLRNAVIYDDRAISAARRSLYAPLTTRLKRKPWLLEALRSFEPNINRLLRQCTLSLSSFAFSLSCAADKF